jgi:hypothetical protein
MRAKIDAQSEEAERAVRDIRRATRRSERRHALAVLLEGAMFAFLAKLLLIARTRLKSFANLIFELSHTPKSKPRRDHPSVLIMSRRILADHRRLCFLCADARDTNDVLVEHSMSAVLAIGGKHFRSFRHRDDVFVARYRPKSSLTVVFGIPGDRRFAPEPREDLMWDAIAIEIRILEVDEGGVHQYIPFERPPDLRQDSVLGLQLQLPY